MSPSASRILIADDNDANVELLEAFLADVPCEIERARDGAETLEKVRSFQPDLLLLDVMMPKLNGFEVCKQLKEAPDTRKIMILMVTALNELGDIERAVSAGTDDFLSKPIQKMELLKRVENMLKLTRMGVVIAPPVPAFYTRPDTIDQLVNYTCARLLDQFDIHVDMARWPGLNPAAPPVGVQA